MNKIQEKLNKLNKAKTIVVNSPPEDDIFEKTNPESTEPEKEITTDLKDNEESKGNNENKVNIETKVNNESKDNTEIKEIKTNTNLNVNPPKFRNSFLDKLNKLKGDKTISSSSDASKRQSVTETFKPSQKDKGVKFADKNEKTTESSNNNAQPNLITITSSSSNNNDQTTTNYNNPNNNSNTNNNTNTNTNINVINSKILISMVDSKPQESVPVKSGFKDFLSKINQNISKSTNSSPQKPDKEFEKQDFPKMGKLKSIFTSALNANAKANNIVKNETKSVTITEDTNKVTPENTNDTSTNTTTDNKPDKVDKSDMNVVSAITTCTSDNICTSDNTCNNHIFVHDNHKKEKFSPRVKNFISQLAHSAIKNVNAPKTITETKPELTKEEEELKKEEAKKEADKKNKWLLSRISTKTNNTVNFKTKKSVFNTEVPDKEETGAPSSNILNLAGMLGSKISGMDPIKETGEVEKEAGDDGVNEVLEKHQSPIKSPFKILQEGLKLKLPNEELLMTKSTNHNDNENDNINNDNNNNNNNENDITEILLSKPTIKTTKLRKKPERPTFN